MCIRDRYRYKFEKGKPEHPFNKLSNIDFLIKINALRQSRQNSDIEPTVAGLLVFGKHTSIKDVYKRQLYIQTRLKE